MTAKHGKSEPDWDALELEFLNHLDGLYGIVNFIGTQYMSSELFIKITGDEVVNSIEFERWLNNYWEW